MTHSHITNAERGEHMKHMARSIDHIAGRAAGIPPMAIRVRHEIMNDHVEYFAELKCGTMTHRQFLSIWRDLRYNYGKWSVEFSESKSGVSFDVIESFWWTADEIAQVTTD